MFAEVAGFDLQHLLAVLLMLESKDALSVNKAVAKVVPGFVVPPPGPRPKEDASSKSFGEATTQQQLQQILMQQQRQQEMMMQRLQQVQQELQTMKAQAAAWPPAPQQHWPEENADSSCAPAGDGLQPRGQPATSSSTRPAFAGYTEDATDVREWEGAMATDVAGLVQDLRLKYLNGTALAGSFGRLRDWVEGVAHGGGWTYNLEIVRLGNNLLQEVRLHHYWCTKQLPRAASWLRRRTTRWRGQLPRSSVRGPRSGSARPRFGGKGSKKGYAAAQGNVRPGGK
ncbi:hypothetical protein DIPPA_27389 [Diplonema papillatum]|nr:hypothetical protein DIPPA_27389 [Diplonema papillatum]